VVAAQVAFKGERLPHHQDVLERRQQSISGLNLSAARILQLWGVQVVPQEKVLWLEQYGDGAKWGQPSPKLVVLLTSMQEVRKEVTCTLTVKLPVWLVHVALCSNSSPAAKACLANSPRACGARCQPSAQ
jgi:hypothetical protein